MKVKLRLRPYVMPAIYVVLVAVLLMSTVSTFNVEPDVEEEVNYVSKIIPTNDVVPVIGSSEMKINKPYTDEMVKIGKTYYDYLGNENDQNNAIIYYQNTYIQNSGVDYVSDKIFDVLAILPGTVISVESNDLLGNVVEVKHDNNLISVYQGLSTVAVKEGSVIKEGAIIGKSGTSKLNIDLGNHLHFELFKAGEVVNPELYYGKDLKDL